MKSTPNVWLVLTLLLIACQPKPIQYNDPVPDHESFALASKILNETRTLNVWLPPQYKSGDAKYPVVYMPDGGIVGEDFPHIANTLAELISAGTIQPVILVGIQNTNRKRDLTGPTVVAKDKEWIPENGGSDAFRRFIRDELFMEVNKRYRTTDTRTIVGESLAGLFVTETFLLAPDMFNNYIAIDPSLWWNDQYLVKNAGRLLATGDMNGRKFWFAGSSTKDIQEATSKLADVLTKVVRPGLHWKYSPEPNEKHNTIFKAVKQNAFLWMLGK